MLQAVPPPPSFATEYRHVSSSPVDSIFCPHTHACTGQSRKKTDLPLPICAATHSSPRQLLFLPTHSSSASIGSLRKGGQCICARERECVCVRRASASDARQDREAAERSCFSTRALHVTQDPHELVESTANWHTEMSALLVLHLR